MNQRIKILTHRINDIEFIQHIVTDTGFGEIVIHRLENKLGDHLGIPHYNQECHLVTTYQYDGIDSQRTARNAALRDAIRLYDAA